MPFCCSLELAQGQFFSLFQEHISTWSLFFINATFMMMNCVENAIILLELFEAGRVSQQQFGQNQNPACVINTVVSSNRSKSPSTALIALMMVYTTLSKTETLWIWIMLQTSFSFKASFLQQY